MFSYPLPNRKPIFPCKMSYGPKQALTISLNMLDLKSPPTRIRIILLRTFATAPAEGCPPNTGPRAVSVLPWKTLCPMRATIDTMNLNTPWKVVSPLLGALRLSTVMHMVITEISANTQMPADLTYRQPDHSLSGPRGHKAPYLHA